MPDLFTAETPAEDVRNALMLIEGLTTLGAAESGPLLSSAKRRLRTAIAKLEGRELLACPECRTEMAPDEPTPGHAKCIWCGFVVELPVEVPQ